MGLGSWFEDKTDGRTVRMSRANLEKFARQCEASPEFLSRNAKLLASAIRELWPSAPSDPIDCVIGIRQHLDRLSSDSIFDTAYKLQSTAINLKKQGMAELSAPLGFLSEWVNVVSIARRKSSKEFVSAAQLAEMYESAMTDLLSRAKLTAA